MKTKLKRLLRWPTDRWLVVALALLLLVCASKQAWGHEIDCGGLKEGMARGEAVHERHAAAHRAYVRGMTNKDDAEVMLGLLSVLASSKDVWLAWMQQSYDHHCRT